MIFEIGVVILLWVIADELIAIRKHLKGEDER